MKLNILNRQDEYSNQILTWVEFRINFPSFQSKLCSKSNAGWRRWKHCRWLCFQDARLDMHHNLVQLLSFLFVVKDQEIQVLLQLHVRTLPCSQMFWMGPRTNVSGLTLLLGLKKDNCLRQNCKCSLFCFEYYQRRWIKNAK